MGEANGNRSTSTGLVHLKAHPKISSNSAGSATSSASSSPSGSHPSSSSPSSSTSPSKHRKWQNVMTTARTCSPVTLALICTLLAILTLTTFFITSQPIEAQGVQRFQASEPYSDSNATLDSNMIHPIRQISIIGERNSGTRWTFDHISECFNHSIRVSKRLTRYKHWFQYKNPRKYPADTLVIAQFRNPYDWFKAMEHVPHHSPAHLRTRHNASADSVNSENDWFTFLTKPWTMERVGADLEIAASVPADKLPMYPCQDDFVWRDIISCTIEPLPHAAYPHTLRYSEHQPFYEMRNDGSGEPYANILELRTAKINNFLEITDWPGIADVWRVQYEFLLYKGTEHLLRRISEWTGVEPRCEAKPAQWRKPKKSRRLSPEFCRHIRTHLNWTAEEAIGYKIQWQLEDESDLDVASTTAPQTAS